MNKNLIRLTESDLHNIIKESVKKVLREMGGDVITCYGAREAITNGGYADGVIFLSMNPSIAKQYGGDLIAVDVNISNFYKAKDAQEAIAVARDNQEGYSGVIYHSNYDGDVCAVFDQSCIIGKAF